MTDLNVETTNSNGVTPSEQRKAIVVCAQYAKDDEELRMFVQMLALVD